MQPGRFNFTIIQGDSFNTTPSWKVNNNYVNVTGYSAKMDVKQAVNSAGTIVELSSDNGRITVGTTDGKFTLALTAAETAALPPGNYIYDLDTTSPSGYQYTLLSGGFSIKPQVSI